MPWFACKWCGEVAAFDGDDAVPQRCTHCFRKAGWEALTMCTCPTDEDGDVVPQSSCELHWRQVFRADPPPNGHHP